MRFAVCLQKKSFTGSTGVLWEIKGVKPFHSEVETVFSIHPKEPVGVKKDGGAVGFCAAVIVIWECVKWTDDMGAIVEAWANGDLQLRSDSHGG